MSYTGAEIRMVQGLLLKTEQPTDSPSGSRETTTIPGTIIGFVALPQKPMFIKTELYLIRCPSGAAAVPPIRGDLISKTAEAQIMTLEPFMWIGPMTRDRPRKMVGFRGLGGLLILICRL